MERTKAQSLTMPSYNAFFSDTQSGNSMMNAESISQEKHSNRKHTTGDRRHMPLSSLISPSLYDSHGVKLPVQKIDYEVQSWSSYSANYHPKNININKPTDQSSRWSSGSSNQFQYIILKLNELSIVHTITFGKYHKNHPCNLKEFKVYGGLTPTNMVELIHSGLRNDNEPETFHLKYRGSNNVNSKAPTFPCQYIKICPLLAWEANFPFSVWFVGLRGIADTAIVQTAYWNYINYKEREVIRLCMKHFRQRNYMDSFDSIQQHAQLRLEDPFITELHNKLVNEGDFQSVEIMLTDAAERGLLQDYLSDCVYKPSWKKLIFSEDDRLPSKRGGHQMVIHPTNGQIFLFGGWDGTQDLSDFWMFDQRTHRWQCLSENTQENGPIGRSCHKMCLDPSTNQIYVLGRYVDRENLRTANLDPDFWKYDIAARTWGKLSSNTAVEGGPNLVYDHQMVIDTEFQMIYVFGGRFTSTDSNINWQYSGLYSYNIATKHWRKILDDFSQPENTIQLKSRIGHSMLLNPLTRELYIFAGQRKNNYLSDFYIFDIDTETVYECSRDYSKVGGPDSGFTQRATINPELGEFYVLSGLMRERTTAQETMKNSFWVYNLKKDKWSKVYQNENTEPDYWNKMLDKEPCPRFAHQVVYDPRTKTHFLFGGNPGESSNLNQRLGDFWEFHLSKPSEQEVLRRLKFFVRKQRYREICANQTESETINSSSSNLPSPRLALHYLQTEIASLIDHTNEEESKEFRELAALLFSGPGNQESMISPQSVTTLFAEPQAFTRLENHVIGGMGGIPMSMDSANFSGNELFTPVKGPIVLADERYQLRTQLYEQLILHFPENMREPANNLVDFVEQGAF